MPSPKNPKIQIHEIMKITIQNNFPILEKNIFSQLKIKK
jgi:hypothetical protein